MVGFRYLTHNDKGELVECSSSDEKKPKVEDKDFKNLDVDKFLKELRENREAFLKKTSGIRHFRYLTHDENGKLQELKP